MAEVSSVELIVLGSILGGSNFFFLSLLFFFFLLFSSFFFVPVTVNVPPWIRQVLLTLLHSRLDECGVVA